MDTPKIFTVIIAGNAGDHVPALNVNGSEFALAFNAEIDLPEHAYLALMESTYGPITSLVSPPEPAIGDGDGAAADTGGDSGGTETFDADAVIKGTVAQVAERLAALTSEEIDAVEAAEQDREQSRKGVLDAIAAARAANTPTPPSTDNQE